MSPSQRFSWAQGLVIGLVVGISLDSLGVRAEAPPAFRGLRPFVEALTMVDSHYVDPVDTTRLFEGAIRGVVATLDPHSEYLDATEVESFQSHTAGHFVGIGVEIATRDGWLVITSVLPGGPALAAGLRPGDKVLAIDGTYARDLPLLDAIRRVRGDAGSELELSIRREGQADAVVVRVRRAQVEVRAVESRLLEDRTLYVRLRTFQESTAQELRRALDDASERAGREGLRGLVLDLRENGGGLYFQAVEVVDEFVASGPIVTTRGRDGRVMNRAIARERGTRGALPIVVLVDEFSASASEIVAGALQDHGRAVLVGTRTFGKGSVQTLVPLSGGAAIKLTTGRYFTPSGRAIQAQGLEPDLVVSRAPGELDADELEARERTRESALERHLEPVDAEGIARVPGPLSRIAAERVPTEPREEGRRAFPGDRQAQMGHAVLVAIAGG